MQELAQAESEQDFNDIRAELTEGGYIRYIAARSRRAFSGRPSRRRFPHRRPDFWMLVGRSNRQNDKLTGKDGGQE